MQRTLPSITTARATTYGSLPPLPVNQEKWAELTAALRLCPQEHRVVECVLRGMQDKQIAAATGLAIPTVRTYLQRAFGRLKVEGRLELVLKIFAMSHQDLPSTWSEQ